MSESSSSDHGVDNDSELGVVAPPINESVVERDTDDGASHCSRPVESEADSEPLHPDEMEDEDDGEVPTFFSSEQVSSLITALFNGMAAVAVGQTADATIMGDKSSSEVLSLPDFLDAFPLFAEGDFAELQQHAHTSMQRFQRYNCVVSRRDGGPHEGECVPGLAAGESLIEAGAVDVPSIFSRAQSASASDAGSRKIGTSVPARALGSAPLNRRNSVVASQIASSKQHSLYRPQTAGGGSSQGGGSVHVISLDPLDNNAIGKSNEQSLVLPEPSSRPATCSIRPQSSGLAKSAAENAQKTFYDVEKQLKDERGQNRFAFTEYHVEEHVEDHAVVDRRKKSIQTNMKDLDLLHSLDPQRRQYIMQLFNDPETMEKRRKRLEAEDLLREVRRAQSATFTTSARQSSERRSSPGRQQMQSPQRPSSVEPREALQSKRWAGAQNELEVWNAVRTRPPSAAAALPFDSPAATASSVVARLIPRPQSSDSALHQTDAFVRPVHNMSFADMVAQRRESFHVYRNQQHLTEMQTRNDSAPGTPAVAAACTTPPSATSPRRVMSASNAPNHSVVSVIEVGELGFHPKAEHFVRTVELSELKSDAAVSPLPFTTIATAAYIPMAQKAPPSASLPQRERAAVGGKLSRSRARIESIKQRGNQATSAGAALPEGSGTVPTGSSNLKAAVVKATKSASTAASAVATAAAIRVQRTTTTDTPLSQKKAHNSVEPWPL